MKGQDGQQHSLETKADSLFGAAYAGVEQWAKLWWYSPNAVIEVRDGERSWRVRAQRVSAWHAKRFQAPGA